MPFASVEPSARRVLMQRSRPGPRCAHGSV